MKSKIIENRYFVECTCGSPEHLLCFDFDDNNEVDIFFTSNYKAPWYKRIWYSLQFIFNRKKFYWGDVVIIDIEQLEEIIDKIKGNKK